MMAPLKLSVFNLMIVYFMMSKMMGAPLGGTTHAGQYGLELSTLVLITPSKGSEHFFPG